MRSSKPVVAAAAAAIVLGGAGLARGAMSPVSHTGGMTMGGGGSITVTGAFVRAPIPPTPSAVAYFTVTNPTSSADRVLQVTTGAGATAVLHAQSSGGGMRAMSSRGVVVPAHGQLVLSAGGAHLMIEKLFGRLRAGQTVDIEVDFDRAGAIDVVAPVIAYGAPAPTAQATHAQSKESSSGAHS